MSDTSVQTKPATTPAPVPPGPLDALVAQAKGSKDRNPLVLALETIGSLRITVTLFVLSLILVFMGTLAQIDSGIHTVARSYFYGWFTWIPFQLLIQLGQKFFGFPHDWSIGGALPFPGGFTIGAALLINLVEAYSLRVPSYTKQWKNYASMFAVLAVVLVLGYISVLVFSQWLMLASWAILLLLTVGALYPFHRHIFFPGNRIGIFTLHIGLVVMIIGEFITGHFAVEGLMIIEEGETTNAVVHLNHHELAIADTSDKDTDTYTVVPAPRLRRGEMIKHDNLPFSLQSKQWLVNHDLIDPKTDDENLATKGKGLKVKAVPIAEASGAASDSKEDFPATYVELFDKDSGESMGTYLFSMFQKPQKIRAGGKEYEVSLRRKMSHKPYSLKLEKFTFERHLGTAKAANRAKNFQSDVVVIDEDGNTSERKIYMNFPLRYRGDTLFQAGWNEQTERGTRLQVVRNPAWQLPYWSCAIVSLGMLMHFGLNLMNYLGRRASV